MKANTIGLVTTAVMLCAGSVTRAQVTYMFTTINPPGTTAGAGARGINAAGTIVGEYGTSTLDGYVRSPSGSYTTIDVPGADGTGAVGVNAADQVVGYYGAASRSHGFLLSGGSYTTLDVPGATGTIASGINGPGQVVGYLADNAGQFNRSFLWSASAGFTTFVVPGVTQYTEANGINDAGEVVGYYSNSAGVHGFVRSPAGVYTTIDAPGSDAKFPSTQVEGINNVGVIAGFFSDATTGLDRGFVRSGGVYTSVDVPGAFYTHVIGINDVGQLVGVYGTTLNDSQGFLATPVPEPGSLILCGVGLLPVVGRRLRQRLR